VSRFADLKTVRTIDLKNVVQQKDRHIQNLENIIQQNHLKICYFSQLFIDTGHGFSEEQSIVQNMQGDEQQFEFDISNYQNIKNLRFDPLNVVTALQIEHIVVIDEQGSTHELSYQPVNVYAQVSEILMFDTEDPQILITLPDTKKFRKVVIQLRYVTIGAETYQIILQ
jgi:hypothetical protein